MAALAVVAAPAAQPGAAFDILIRNGLLVDGTGAAGVATSVGIRGGRIAEIGALTGATAPETIDASGLVIAPGSSTSTRTWTRLPRSQPSPTSSAWV